MWHDPISSRTACRLKQVPTVEVLRFIWEELWEQDAIVKSLKQELIWSQELQRDYGDVHAFSVRNIGAMLHYHKNLYRTLRLDFFTIAQYLRDSGGLPDGFDFQWGVALGASEIR